MSSGPRDGCRAIEGIPLEGDDDNTTIATLTMIMLMVITLALKFVEATTNADNDEGHGDDGYCDTNDGKADAEDE